MYSILTPTEISDARQKKKANAYMLIAMKREAAIKAINKAMTESSKNDFEVLLTCESEADDALYNELAKMLASLGYETLPSDGFFLSVKRLKWRIKD